jgi:tRNA (guanine37-N1)-methyltransferase
VRLLPGALGHEDAAANESCQGKRLDFPQFTRPREYRGLSVPDVLLSGNHAEVARWRAAEAERRTHERRPDLLDAAMPTPSHGLDCVFEKSEVGRVELGFESQWDAHHRRSRIAAAALQGA